MARREWTEAEEGTLRRLYPTSKMAELREALPGRTAKAISSRAKVLGLRKAEGFDRSWNNRTWTEAEEEWFRSYVPGHSWREISAEHLRLFGTPMSKGKVQNRKTASGLHSGTVGGRFEPGHVPKNKGRRWSEYLPPETQERCRRTQFGGEGFRPHNTAPVGAERRTPYGVEVKVAMRPFGRVAHDNWRPRGIVNWERANGEPWPDGCRCVHADGDCTNDDPGNVVPVPKELYSTLHIKSAIGYHDRESLEVAMAYARVKQARRRLAEESKGREG